MYNFKCACVYLFMYINIYMYVCIRKKLFYISNARKSSWYINVFKKTDTEPGLTVFGFVTSFLNFKNTFTY
jgi:hypothetical protein